MRKLRKEVLDGELVVKCTTAEEMATFLSVVEENNVKWGSGREIGDFNPLSDEKLKHVNCLQIYGGGLFYGSEEDYEGCGATLTPFNKCLWFEKEDEEGQKVTGIEQERVVRTFADLEEDLTSPFGLVGRLNKNAYAIYDEINMFGIPQGKIKQYNRKSFTAEQIVRNLQKLGFYVRYEEPQVERTEDTYVESSEIDSIEELDGKQNINFKIIVDGNHLFISMGHKDRIVYDNTLEAVEEILKDLPVFGFNHYTIKEAKIKVKKLMFGEMVIAEFDGKTVKVSNEGIKPVELSNDPNTQWDFIVVMVKLHAKAFGVTVTVVEE